VEDAGNVKSVAVVILEEDYLVPTVRTQAVSLVAFYG
jgi:hypothetical protein